MSTKQPWTLEGALSRLDEGRARVTAKVERAELGNSTRSPLTELRLLAKNFDEQVPAWFSDEYTLDELVKIHRAWLDSEHDVPPQFWTTRQVLAALEGHPPKWSLDGEPF